MLSPPIAAHPAVKRVIDYPAGRFERAVLNLITDPQATAVFRQSWTITQALRISKPIDASRLTTAFRQVVARHETLRSRFVRRPEGWRLLVEDQHRTGPVITDLGDVSSAEIASVIERARREDFDVENGPLFRIDLLKCGKRGDVLLVRAHHLVTDGWSQIQVCDELVRAGFGMPFAAGKPLTYGAYLERFERAAPALEAKYEAYWRRLLLPVLPMPKLGRMAKGLVPNLSGLSLGPTSRLTGVMEADAVARVHALARNSGCTLNNVVGAAFASVLARRGGVDGIYFNTPFAGRVHPDLRSFVGFVCDYVPVRCDVTAAGSLGALSRAIGDQMRQSYQHMPASVTKCDAAFDDLINGAGGHLRQFECGMFIPESAIRGSLLAPVLDGDLGRVIRLGPVEIEWLEAAGTRADAAEFDLRILERKGGLELILNYDTEAFEATEAQDILAEIVALLSAA